MFTRTYNWPRSWLGYFMRGALIRTQAYLIPFDPKLRQSKVEIQTNTYRHRIEITVISSDPIAIEQTMIRFIRENQENRQSEG